MTSSEKQHNKRKKQAGRLKIRKVSSKLMRWFIVGSFILFAISFLIASGVGALIVSRWKLDDYGSLFAYTLSVLAVSFVIGICLSFAYSQIMIMVTDPYLEALQKVGDCDFSVRIKDNKFMSEFNIAEHFNKTVERLASVETLRESFISEFSHEFKTPIVSISGFAKLLKDPNLSAEERNEYLDVIIDESERLVELSESVLTLTRLDSQQIDNVEYRLDEQIRQCVLLFANTCKQRNIGIELDLQVKEICGWQKLNCQIWTNLLSNAVKFTPDGGKIEVNAAYVEDDVQVSVSDNGIGMDEETQQNIFYKFYQGDKSHTTAGNGLGLSIVKKIVDMQDGKIEVSSQPGKGSTFVVTLAKNG